MPVSQQHMDAPFPIGMVEDIESVFAHDTDPYGLDLYEAVFESGLMFPLQRREEMRAMMRIARSINPKVCMEIGSDKSGGCYHWIKGLKPEGFIGIEVRGVPYASLFQQHFGKTTKQCWLGESSYDPLTVQSVRHWLGDAPIDVLFIDGDKARFDLDFALYLPMVRDGGIIFMHDVRDQSPGNAFRTCRGNKRVKESLVVESTTEIADLVLRMRAGGEAAKPRNAWEGWAMRWKGDSCGLGVMWV